MFNESRGGNMTFLNAIGPQVLRMKQVLARTGLSRSAIYDKLDSKSSRYDPTFPKQFKLGPGAVGWLEADIEIWIESRISASRANMPHSAAPQKINSHNGAS